MDATEQSPFAIRLIAPLMLGASLALAYSSGPPDGKTGRPGEGTCLDCHSGAPGSSDSASITGFGGTTYAPGQTYSLALHVTYAGQRRWGFELTTAAVNSGAYAGQLIVTDPTNTRFSTSGGRGYLKHTSSGTYAGQADSATWVFQWQAPTAGAGPVVFYWCNNAANNNGASSGDTIIRDSMVVAEAAGVNSQPKHGRFAWRYSSPIRNHVVISYQGTPDLPVRIYSAEGRRVRALRPIPDGELLQVNWDGRDDAGRTVPEARYFIRLGTEVTSVVQVQLVR